MDALHRAGAWLGLSADEDWAEYEDPDGDQPLDDDAEPAPEPEQDVRSDEDLLPVLAPYRIASIRLTSFSGMRGVAERYRDGTPVIIDLTGLDAPDAQRVVDFSAGLIFGLCGSLERLAHRVFLLLPPNAVLDRA